MGDLIPEFGTNGKDVVTVEQVLLHTVRLPDAPARSAGTGTTARAPLERFDGWRLNWEPGHAATSTTPTSAHWVLAELIERVTGADYRDFIHARVLDPLGLAASALGVPAERAGRRRQPRQHVGEPPTPDELEAAIGVRRRSTGRRGDRRRPGRLRRPEIRAVGVPGGGGVSRRGRPRPLLPGAAPQPGRALGRRRCSPTATGHVRNTFPTRCSACPRTGRSAWSSPATTAGAAPRLRPQVSPATFGHDGAGGQIAWADPDSGLSFAYLTNGLDRNVLREWRRTAGIATRAARCADDPSE